MPSRDAASDPFAAEAECEHVECDYIDGRGPVCVECGETVPVKTSGGRPKGSRPIRSAAKVHRWDYSVNTFAQAHQAGPCERCGGGRIDYRLNFDDGSVEQVCWGCCRASLLYSPHAREVTCGA